MSIKNKTTKTVLTLKVVDVSVRMRKTAKKKPKKRKENKRTLTKYKSLMRMTVNVDAFRADADQLTAEYKERKKTTEKKLTGRRGW